MAKAMNQLGSVYASRLNHTTIPANPGSLLSPSGKLVRPQSVAGSHARWEKDPREQHDLARPVSAAALLHGQGEGQLVQSAVPQSRQRSRSARLGPTGRGGMKDSLFDTVQARLYVEDDESEMEWWEAGSQAPGGGLRFGMPSFDGDVATENLERARKVLGLSRIFREQPMAVSARVRPGTAGAVSHSSSLAASMASTDLGGVDGAHGSSPARLPPRSQSALPTRQTSGEAALSRSLAAQSYSAEFPTSFVCAPQKSTEALAHPDPRPGFAPGGPLRGSWNKHVAPEMLLSGKPEPLRQKSLGSLHNCLVCSA